MPAAGTLIVGYGNPLRRDDGFGPAAARRLIRVLPGATVLILPQLMPELAQDLSRAELAVFIDAALGTPPGRVSVQALEPADATTVREFTHALTPPALLALCQALYARRPRAFQVTACGGDFSLGEGLSPVLSGTLPEVVEQVRRLTG